MKTKSKIASRRLVRRWRKNRQPKAGPPLAEKSNIRIVFIGGGNMAEAMLRGILRTGLYRADQIIVADIDPRRREYLRRKLGVLISADNITAAGRAAVAVLAVKPQQAGQVLAELRKKLPENTLLISIVTGFSTGKIWRALGQPVRIIRVVPNTPALVGAGASAYCCGRGANRQDARRAEKILQSIGTTVRLAEPRLNAATALSGSGPAYVFYLMEALLQAAQEIGLPEKEARELLLATVAGSARLLKATGLPPAELRRRVTSRRGTTAAALRVLEKGKVRERFVAAVKAAHRRARELARPK